MARMLAHYVARIATGPRHAVGTCKRLDPGRCRNASAALAAAPAHRRQLYARASRRAATSVLDGRDHGLGLARLISSKEIAQMHDDGDYHVRALSAITVIITSISSGLCFLDWFISSVHGICPCVWTLGKAAG